MVPKYCVSFLCPRPFGRADETVGELIFAVCRVAPMLVWMGRSDLESVGGGGTGRRYSTLVGCVGPQAAMGAGPRRGSSDEGCRVAGFPSRVGRSNSVARPGRPPWAVAGMGVPFWQQCASWEAAPVVPSESLAGARATILPRRCTEVPGLAAHRRCAVNLPSPTTGQASC
jgi:hypothetical protein